ncbi:MAG: DUF4358 domain-containing protein [Bacillota bacterium]|nr:DUF4358 domain-containing protein [Bacillota bacterium]
MKKLIAGLLVIMMMFAAAGCSGDDETQSANGGAYKAIAAADLAKYIAENVEFKDFMDTVDSEILYKVYGLDGSGLSDACAYFSTGATAEEITVLTSDDREGADKAEEACRRRIEIQKEGFENYVPEELVKLNSPVIKREGNTVIMVICDNSASAEEAIKAYIDNL